MENKTTALIQIQRKLLGNEHLKCPEAGKKTLGSTGFALGAEAALSDYKFKKQIGEGAFGLVFKASNTTTKETVAVKVITDIFSCEQQAISILREVKILRQLRQMKEQGCYTHSVTLQDFIVFEEAGVVCAAIVMEYKRLSLKNMF